MVSSSKRRRRLLGVLCGIATLALAGVGVGCSESGCDPDATRCGDAQTIDHCVVSGGNCDENDIVCTRGTGAWQHAQSCGDGTTCVIAGGQAACSFTPQPDPHCVGGGTVCWGNSMALCTDGYPVPDFDCGGNTCKQEPGGYDRDLAGTGSFANCAYCSNGTEIPDSACAAGQAATCAGTGLYGCSCADRAALTQDCAMSPGPDGSATGGVCLAIERPGGTPGPLNVDVFCAISATPDPQCGPDSSDGYCAASGMLQSCSDRYDVATIDGPMSCF
jgi:hypothetical protein